MENVPMSITTISLFVWIVGYLACRAIMPNQSRESILAVSSRPELRIPLQIASILLVAATIGVIVGASMLFKNWIS